MNSRAHASTYFLLQSQSSALFDSFASQRIYGYVLSREQPNTIARIKFSIVKKVLA